ncbi:MAG: hypothetical protein HY611_08155 [Elusimicrobia bacterium]|nr:hypothetical protein [Elusimicrobiota bacterium]
MKKNEVLALAAGVLLASLGTAGAVKFPMSPGGGTTRSEVFNFPKLDARVSVEYDKIKEDPFPMAVILEKKGEEAEWIKSADLDRLAVYDQEEQKFYNRWFIKPEGLYYADSVLMPYGHTTYWGDPKVVGQLESIINAVKARGDKAMKKAEQSMRDLKDAQAGLEREYAVVENYVSEPAGKVVRKQAQRTKQLERELESLKSDRASEEKIKNLIDRIEQELNDAARLETTNSNMR